MKGNEVLVYAAPSCITILAGSDFVVVSVVQWFVYEAGVHSGNHAPVHKRTRTWNAQQEEVMNAHLESNPTATAKSMFKHFRGESMFQEAGVRHFEVWFRKLRPKTATSRPTTLRELSSQFTEYRTSWDDVLAKGEDESLCLQLPHVDNIVIGQDIRRITGQQKPKTTIGGLQYAFCFPMTTKALFANAAKSRQQTYLTFETITPDGPEFKEIQSQGVGMCDGVFQLVEGNTGILLRVITTTRNGLRRRIGYSLVSYEDSWCVASTFAAFQRLAVVLHQQPWNKPFLEWLIIDNGSALTKGVKQHLANPSPAFSGI
jgi:hypothetical protein